MTMWTFSGDIDHLRERLYVHWDIVNYCNYKCFYCYARKHYKHVRIYKFDVYLKILEIIYKSPLPIFLGILGGEPTLFPHYFELIDLIQNEYLPRHEKNRLYITTNASKGLDFWKKHKKNEKTFVLWSIHPQYQDNYKDFFDKVSIMEDKGYKQKINVMLVDNEKYWPFLHKILDKCFSKQSDRIEIHPHFTYHNVNKLYDYSARFWREFEYLKDMSRRYIKFENESQSVVLNDYEIFRNKYNTFQGMKCYHNNYEIINTWEVVRLCQRDQKPLLAHPDYFEKINKIEPIICPYKYCCCDGLLKIHKVRE